jgi:hypothetical protein
LREQRLLLAHLARELYLRIVVFGAQRCGGGRGFVATAAAADQRGSGGQRGSAANKSQ